VVMDLVIRQSLSGLYLSFGGRGFSVGVCLFVDEVLCLLD
jgi:hypothetical protein